MKILSSLLTLLLFGTLSYGQSLVQRLDKAYQQLANDEQAKHAIVGLCVLDSKTGKIIYAKNEQIGLATASTLKTITSATAFYSLGRDFKYETLLSYSGKISPEGLLHGNIIIKGFGDPSLGSWRYPGHTEDELLKQWTTAIQNLGIKKIEGKVIADDSAFGTASVPNGWIWQDIGNYYGAGGSAICWRENQFEVLLKAGSQLNDPVQVTATQPLVPYLKIINELKTGNWGTGDQAYGFLPPYRQTAYLRGTWAMGIQKQGIALALPDAAYDLAYRLETQLKAMGIICQQNASTQRIEAENQANNNKAEQLILRHQSPSLSEIVYWFNKKSINLYGEQLLKTMAYLQGVEATTANGAKFLIDFWKKKGIDPRAMNIIDGSGLSPGNRVSCLAMAQVLFQSQKEPWFQDYLRSFPLYNDMTLKSGNINDVTAYCGYHGSYIVVININNYNGSRISNKLFKVLDVLK